MVDRIDKTIVRIEADQRAANRLIQEVGRIRASLQGAASEVKTFGVESKGAERNLAKYGDSARDAGRRIDTMRETMSTLRRETLEAAEAQQRFERNLRDVGDAARVQERQIRSAEDAARLYGDVESRTRGVTGLLSAVGATSIAAPLNIGADVLGAAEGVGLLREELPRLTQQLGITKQNAALLAVEMGVLVGATLVIKDQFGDLADSLNGVKVAVAGQAGALQEYYDTIEFGTRDQVKEEQERLARHIETRQQLLADLTQLDQAFEAGLDVSDEGVLETFAEGALRVYEMLGGDIGRDELTKIIEDTETDLSKSQRLFNLYTQGLIDNATGLADSEALLEANTARRIAALERESQVEVENAQLIRSLTSEAAQNRVDDIGLEREALQALEKELEPLSEVSDEAQEKLNSVRDQLFLLNQEEERYISAIIPGVRAKEAATEAEEARKKAAEDFEKASKAALAIEERRTKLIDTYNAREEDIRYRRQVQDVREAEDWARRQMEARAKLNADLMSLDRKVLQDRENILEELAKDLADADKDQIKALRQFQEDEKRATVDYWNDIAQINRDERLSVQDAAARLDAQAVFDAQQAAKEQRATRTQQFDKERAERAEDYKQRLAELAEQRDEKKKQAALELQDLEEKHVAERKMREQAYAEQLKQESEARQLRLRREQEDRRYEDQLRQAQFASELLAINQLKAAADSLAQSAAGAATAAAQAAASSPASGGGTTASYLQEIQRTAGRYVTDSSGRRIRVDMYDPQQSGGMSAGAWYNWKQLMGYKYGGMPPVGQDVLVGENGPEWARFMVPTRIYPNGQLPPPSVNNSRSVGNIHIQIDGAQSPQDVAAEVRRELMLIF